MRNAEARAIAEQEGLAVPDGAVPYEVWVRRAAAAFTCRPFGSDPTPEHAEIALLAALYPVPGDGERDAGYPSACWWPIPGPTLDPAPRFPSHPGLVPLLHSLYAVAWCVGSSPNPRLDVAGTPRDPVLVGTLPSASADGRVLAFYQRIDPRSLACPVAGELACLWATIASQAAPPRPDIEALIRARDVLRAAWHDEDVCVDDYALAVEGLDHLIPQTPERTAAAADGGVSP